NEVVTPGIEFLDLFTEHSNRTPQETMYKFIDRSGRLIVLRPDSTMPIARLVSTKLKNSDMPIRLYYNQEVYKVNAVLSGRYDEVMQTGVELIGASSNKADIEVIVTAVSALSQHSDNFRLEIGHIGLFKALSSQLPISDDVREDVRFLIESKNYASLNDLLDKIEDCETAQALKQLPSLFGGEEVFEKADKLFTDDASKESLAYLKNLYKELGKLGLRDKIILDLGLVNSQDYYTGVVFRGYVEGVGDEVLSGGRYDNLFGSFGKNIPAIGFGVDASAIARAVLNSQNYKSKAKKADALIYAESEYNISAVRFAIHYSKSGKIAEVSTFDSLEQTKEYAKIKGIEKIIIVSDNVKEINLSNGGDNR
ncbi:MAG: ATP phosphoribosyltransferase regulatory subunit, partial [Oscillospiraceae bacterium]|nr:ATP phosphoribosyltransferase regulatory subunit [Oscillospiraceae bacterium]